MEKNKEIYPVLHDKEYYKNHSFNKSMYINFTTNYNVLISPYIKKDCNIIIGIPIAPSEIISRLAIRETWSKIIITGGVYKMFYIFIMSKPDNKYPFNYLIEEAKIYNDILLFDFINSYKHITILMIMSYKWIIKNCRFIKYFIRSNSDVLLFPNKLYILLEKGGNIIGYKTGNKNITYPSGSFYIFSVKFLIDVVVKSQTVRPIHPTEDIYYGQIMKNISVKNVTWFGLKYYFPISYYRKKKIDIKNTTLIAIHPITSSAMFYLYNFIK